MVEIRSKNVVIWGFHSKSSVMAINTLREKKLIDIKAWIGDAQECTHDIFNFLTGDFNKDRYYGNPQEVYDEIFQNSIYEFMDMMSRHSFYSEKSFHDLMNIFNMLFDLFSSMLIENDVDIVLFSNLPHEGPDLVLFEIAKRLNIKTIMFYQTLFPNRFFYLYDIEDFGKFNEINSIGEIPNFKIENKYEKNLFYMANIKKKKYDLFSLQRSSFGSLWGSLFNRNNYNRIKLFLQRYFRHNTSKNKIPLNINNRPDLSNEHTFSPSNIFLFLKDLLRRFRSFINRLLQRYYSHKKAREDFLNILSHQTNLKKKFVYFPLHLQPELTTSALGGTYVDQLLAIERLSKLVPEDWYIYVKENPKQTELMRGNWFFARLRAIKNVKVVSPEFDTYALIKNSVFVATVTGTAGWEAISGGKSVLIFGNPWYKNLPGVFSYDKYFKLEDILEYEINHEELEREWNLLLSKTGEGVIDEFYAVLVEGFNSADNALSITIFLERLISNL